MGTAEMCEGLIRVRTSSGEIIEFERRKLIGITKGGEEEASHWSGEIGVDFSASDGNTAQIDVSGHVHFQRETGLTRWISDYRGAYGEVDGDKSAENHRASSALDIFLTSRLFVTAPVVEYFRDEFQNISARISPGLAMGYEFIKSDQVE